MRDCIPNELGRRDRPGHNLRQIVLRIQRIVVVSRARELDTVGLRLLYIQISQVVLWLVQPDVQSPGR